MTVNGATLRTKKESELWTQI